VSARDRLVAGLRLDGWRAEDQRRVISDLMTTSPNPTDGERRHETHPGGFARYEHDLGGPSAGTAYVGLGYTERAPDYWELITNESLATRSSFHTRTEKTTQLDTGVSLHRGPVTASVSAFANHVDDYILVEANVPKTMGLTTRSAVVTRNVDTRAWGGEAALGWRFAPRWIADASVAYVAGRNTTDDRPLAQQPPLEGRLSLTYATPRWTVGGLARCVAAQHRYAVNQGTIVGQDLGPTAGFAVYSLNAGWRLTAHAVVTAGVDNLFDRTYAEHLSRNGGAVTGYPVTTRVNEPGRTLWVKLATTF
jgi:iron complex outermembrane receptor protein